MKFSLRNTAAALAVACTFGGALANPGWPANYQGVMLQGFYWDSYDDTKWTNLEAQADELSQYFSLIWVPNSGYAGGGQKMGYTPVFWFNQNSSFGRNSELRRMIATYKEKGVGIIEDVILNHRDGSSKWYDFPKETWNGVEYQIGLEGICSDDELANEPGQEKPRGNRDTGDGFDGSRDLDHTNANVQENCKAFCKYLLDDVGYTGFRLDMVKGYAPQYTKMYNEYAQPQFSVGEYFDGSYDKLAAWIEGTGKTSAAFDFAFKYALNNAFGANDMSQLSWLAQGQPQPAGLIHYGYQQYAVTFIDNHDTYRDHNKFGGNVLAANAFMLCSPGTPCVFLPHWKEYKEQLKPIIAARNAAGVHNMSAVKVFKAERNCYLAEIIGTNGRLAVRVGSTQDTPSGYTAADVVASGNGYCVWSSQGGSGDNPVVPDPDPEGYNVYFDNSVAQWATPHIHYWGGAESTWPGVAMTRTDDGNVWMYTVPGATTGLLFNAGDGDATKTADFAAVANHIYGLNGDHGEYQPGQGGGDEPVTETRYVVTGTMNGWNPNDPAYLMTAKDGAYTYDLGDLPAGTEFKIKTADDGWTTSWGAEGDPAATEAVPVEIPLNTAVHAWRGSSCNFLVSAGAQGAVVTFVPEAAAGQPGTVTLTDGAAVTDITADAVLAAPVYYNLQGVRVTNPQAGTLYIRVQGPRARKVVY